MSNNLGFEIELYLPIDQALEMVTSALKTEGFGVLTSINVKNTLKEKLGVDFRPYLILGVCNPPLAHRALSEDSSIGLMLPCNVTLEELEGPKVIIRIANPEMMMTMGPWQNNHTINNVAGEARNRLERVFSQLRK